MYIVVNVIIIIIIIITVPTAPSNVTLMNTSSTSLMLEWDQPICDNGVRTGYMVCIHVHVHVVLTHVIHVHDRPY